MKTTLTACVFLLVVAMATSMAAMEITAWTTFAVTVVARVRSRRGFGFPLWPALLALIGTVGLTLYLNPPLKPFLIQFGFMRWVILFWSMQWTLDEVWDEVFERRFVTLWMSVIAVMSAYATLQFLFGIDWLRSSHHHLEAQGAIWRAPGTFSNVLTFAYALGTAYFAVAGPYLKLSRARFKPAVVALGSLVTIVPLVRGAVIAAAAAIFSYVTLARRKLIPYYVGLVTAVVGGLAVVSPKVMDNLRGHLENSANERVHLWRAYARMFFDHPWSGVGIFQGDLLLPEYYAKLGITEPFTSHAHNVILQWAAGTGVIGLALYLGLCGYMLRAAWRLRRTSVWGWSLLMAQIYGHVGGLTEANFFDAEVNHAVIFTWALTLFLSARTHAAPAAAAPRS